ncbi:MAG TPA: hypothetical protein VKE27_01015 [Candidatus Dormibacteraeota bacterium]|nr:hypothetical protein [Candidatus Dormibacteraeota bacterium]
MTVLAGTGWPYGANDAIGQTGEFLVWAALISQSGGGLHIFLPLLDRGLDGLIHRLDDDAYIAVQVKAKSTAAHGEAPIAIYEDHLFTPDQVVIGVFLDGGKLGPYGLVIDSATLRSSATRIDDRGRTMLVVDMPVSPSVGHKWSEHLVDVSRLAERLCITAGAPPPGIAAPTIVPSDEDRVIGFIGEQEVCRRLAVLDACGLFRPFPDSEMVELVVRHLATGSTVGFQIKTAQLDHPHDMRHVLIHRATFVAAASTFVVALAWIVSESRFHDTCLLIPSSDVPSVASSDGQYYELHFRPDGSSMPSRLDRYRLPLAKLSDAVSGLLGER